MLPPGHYPNYPPARPAILPQRRPAVATAPNRDKQPAMQGRFRLQGPDEVALTRDLPPLEMPAPETFLRAAASKPAADVDWDAVRRRLEAAGAASCHLQKTPRGFRFSCAVPTANGQRRRLEAEAESEAEAIDAALRQGL